MGLFPYPSSDLNPLTMPLPRYFCLIPAAGVGERMAAACPKQYLSIGGQSILQHSVNAFLQQSAIDHVFVVVSPEDAYVASALQPDSRLTVLRCGGSTRAATVSNGLLAIGTSVASRDWVLVHDAARPGIHADLIRRLIAAVGEQDVGGLLALPVADTVKMQTGSAAARRVKTMSRAGLWLAQTPQMFRYGQLSEALQNSDPAVEITDEASAIEAAGLTPLLVEGHWCNTKITRPADLALVENFVLHPLKNL